MADNVNISPEMISNLVDMLKKNNSSVSSSSRNENTNSSTDNNELNLNEILKNFSSKNSEHYSSTGDSNSSSDASQTIDFETIMKIKSIMETLNKKNDPNSQLLYSLKPYLRKSKQEKFDQYVNILKISQISKLFKQKN